MDEAILRNVTVCCCGSWEWLTNSCLHIVTPAMNLFFLVNWNVVYRQVTCHFFQTFSIIDRLPVKIRQWKFPEVVRRARGLAPIQFGSVFHFPLPLGAKRSKSSVKTKSVQVFPPPEHRTTSPCTFTEWQKVFVGPHHQTKISTQKQPINH